MNMRASPSRAECCERNDLADGEIVEGQVLGPGGIVPPWHLALEVDGIAEGGLLDVRKEAKLGLYFCVDFLEDLLYLVVVDSFFERDDFFF